jgi:hypothetical protein
MTAKKCVSFFFYSLSRSCNRREEKKMDWMLVSTHVTHERILPAFCSYDCFARPKKTTSIVICLIECIITKTKYMYLCERSIVNLTRSILIRKKKQITRQILSPLKKNSNLSFFLLFFLSTYVYMNWLLATCKILSYPSDPIGTREGGKKKNERLSELHSPLASCFLGGIDCWLSKICAACNKVSIFIIGMSILYIYIILF